MNTDELVGKISILLLIWLAYFSLHSWTASLRFKNRVYAKWPKFEPYYRLSYNAISVITLLPPLGLTILWKTDLFLQWKGGWVWLANTLTIIALVLFYRSCRYYDMNAFLGFSARETTTKQTKFCLSPYHRFVRHPWYFFGLLIIWTRDMDIMQLVSSIAITVYLLVGSKLEERKLIEEFGEVYRNYQLKVPGLLPTPWKFLRKHEKL